MTSKEKDAWKIIFEERIKDWHTRNVNALKQVSMVFEN